MTLEGIPHYGIMGVGPRDYIYKLEKYIRKNKITDQGRNYAGWVYLSNKNTPYSYNDALKNNLGIDHDMSLKAMIYRQWLPSLSLGYRLSPDLEVYLNYGRNYMRPYAYVPIAMIYSKNRSKFQVAGISLQDSYDDLSGSLKPRTILISAVAMSTAGSALIRPSFMPVTTTCPVRAQFWQPRGMTCRILPGGC